MRSQSTTCAVLGCNWVVLVQSRGLCNRHYLKWQRHGDAEYQAPRRVCSVVGCERSGGRSGLCKAHYQRQWRSGTTGSAYIPPAFGPRAIRPEPEIADEHTLRIPLGHDRWVSFDRADRELVVKYQWAALKGKNTWYAVSFSESRSGNRMFMHRLILGAEPSAQVDHADGNGLNNRRSNIRIATPNENQHNSHNRKRGKSGLRGVLAARTNGRWVAKITYEKRTKHLGTFDSAEAAGLAYDTAARYLYGQFALTNYS